MKKHCIYKNTNCWTRLYTTKEHFVKCFSILNEYVNKSLFLPLWVSTFFASKFSHHLLFTMFPYYYHEYHYIIRHGNPPRISYNPQISYKPGCALV